MMNEKNPNNEKLEARFNVQEDVSEVVDGTRKLHEKTLPEVLKAISRDDYISRQEILDSGETVKENYLIIDGIQRLFEYLADEYRIRSYNDVLRAVVIHGYEIYRERIGKDIERSFRDQHTRIIHRDRTAIGGDSCNINLDESSNKHTSFALDKEISGAMGSHSRKGCIPKYKLVTLCMLYSLSTFPNLPGWQEIIQNNIKKFEKAQRSRMGIE